MEPRRNPFVFGETVTAHAFCDRETEQDSLVRDLADSQKLFLISPRRYGKTSLLKRVLHTLHEKGCLVVYVDLYRAPSLEKFLGLYCRSVAAQMETTLDKLAKFFRETLPRLRPKISIDAEGAPSVEIEPVLVRRNVLEALEEVIDLPQKIAVKKRRRAVVVLDEFQEILGYDGETIEKGMRALIQHHNRVGYVFAGSKRHLLEDMIGQESRAFYKIGKVHHLGKLPREAFAPFLTGHFERTGFRIERGVVERVLELAAEVPYNVQFLCHEMWDRYRDGKRINTADVDVAMTRLLDEQEPMWISLWDDVSPHQRRVLKATSAVGGSNLFAQEVMAANDIGPAPSLQTSLKLLVKKGLIERANGHYVFSDPFFGEWLRRRI